MPRKYYITADNILILQLTYSCIDVSNIIYPSEETRVIISIFEEYLEGTQCYSAKVIDANVIEGVSFTKVWLQNLKSNSYGVQVTEYTNGPIVYCYNREQLLEAVQRSLTDGKGLKSVF